jgi:hypothetical protein
MLQNARKLRFCLGQHMYLGWLYCLPPSLFGDSGTTEKVAMKLPQSIDFLPSFATIYV